MFKFNIISYLYAVLLVFSGLFRVTLAIDIAVKYEEVPSFDGLMCQGIHVAFDDTSTATKMMCVKKCTTHKACHNVFYDAIANRCVGCGQRYNETSLLGVSSNAKYYRGICNVAMVSGRYGIPDAKITVSSHYVDLSDPELFGPRYSRLYTSGVAGAGAWSAASTSPGEYIQAEFYNVKLLTSVATQGRYDNGIVQCVTSYQVYYSLDCVNFSPVMSAGTIETFSGNDDRSTVVTNSLTNPVYARCARIYPTQFTDYVSMRFDFIGCI